MTQTMFLKAMTIKYTYNRTGLDKNVTQLGRRAGNERINLWKRSISNHLYWCAESSEEKSPDLLQAKWESILNHMQNIHEHSNPLFTHCTHGELTGQERRKKWLKPSKLQ
ncbi:hypothetical protein QZH41_016272 [Actinostola sp. cb2023]|nr:hypothetical protein QZH41_016272 [Actinostola sp. cb2023]